MVADNKWNVNSMQRDVVNILPTEENYTLSIYGIANLYNAYTNPIRHMLNIFVLEVLNSFKYVQISSIMFKHFVNKKFW
jgi:hypothetical protein